MWRRFSGNAVAFDGLSALTQLTRLATDYAGSTQREALYSQLCQLTGLRELDAPMALQTDGGDYRDSNGALSSSAACELSHSLATTPGRYAAKHIACMLDRTTAPAT